MVTSVPFFHASPYLTRIGWLLCAPVAGAVLVQWVHHYLHVPSWLFGLAVTSGGWSPRVSFLPFTAGWFLVMGVDLLHFHSFLSVSTFFVFAVVVFLQISRFSFHSPCPPLAWDFSSGQCPFPSPLSCLCGWGQWSWCPEFPQVGQSLFPSGSFCLVSPFCFGGNFGTCFLFNFYLYIFYIMVSVFFPHFCTRIAAAWLLHVGKSTGWKPTVPAVWSSYPLQTQFI